MKPKAIIIDIDGTLANISHRRHFVDPKSRTDLIFEHEQYDSHGISVDETKGRWFYDSDPFKEWKPDWKSFNEAMVYDTPNEWCIEIVKRFYKSSISNDGIEIEEGFAILFISGREKKFMHITWNQILTWVCKEAAFDRNCKFFMRRDKDYRKDCIIKKEIYETEIEDKYDVLFCLDDNAEIVELWRSLGLVCLDCCGYSRKIPT